MSDKPPIPRFQKATAPPWPEKLDEISWRWTSSLAANRLFASVVIGLVALVTYLPGQINLPAIDRTEGVVALSSRHILETGDWLRPRWEANIQRTRPPGTFWLQGLAAAAVSAPARSNISTYRLPSLIATVAAVLLLFWFAGPLVGWLEALMASLMLAVTPIVALHAQLAIAEPLVLPAIVAAQMALLAIYRDPDAARWRSWLAVFWVAIGTSTWFNALAVPLLALTTVLTLALLDRRWDFVMRLQPLLGVPLLALLSLPWLAALWTIDGGTIFRGMDTQAVLDALEGGQSMKFKTAYGVFVLTLALGFVPVAHMLGPVISRYWRSRHDPTVQFLLVWLVVPILALELLSNKPPLYTVQAVMPAGVMLVAMAMARHRSSAVPVLAWPGMFWTTVLLLCVIAPIVFGTVLWVTGTPVSLLLVAGFLVFAALFLLAGWVSAKGHGMAWFVTGLLGTFVLSLWFNGQLMPGLQNFWTAPQMRELTSKLKSCVPAPVYISGFREPSLALVLAGQAQIGPVEAAVSLLATSRTGYAIVESRQVDRFRDASNQLEPPLEMRRLGCIRAVNLARGCSLRFHVFTVPRTAGSSACKLDALQNCADQPESIGAKLRIKHCSTAPAPGSSM